MENEYSQRTNDNHIMLKNVTLQNETLSSTFKVGHVGFSIECYFSSLILGTNYEYSR